MQVQKNKRLKRPDWVHAGMDVLRARGAEALKAEPMARYMETTKGSFYWHFKDVEDFQASILTLWEQAAIAELSRLLEDEPGGVACFQALARSLADPDKSNAILMAEPAVRAWSTNSKRTREVVARVDEARMNVLTTVLKRIDIGNPDVAHMLYGAAVGIGMIADDTRNKSEAIGSLTDLVLALR
ncbi:MAG: TetR/AcrR family transcriptional regulator [Pseudomonadota bacterium]